MKEKILEEYEKGNIVVATIEGLQTCPFDDFLQQPVDGLLYDLNRDEATIMTFIDDPKWVNNLATTKIIKKLFAERQILIDTLIALQNTNTHAGDYEQGIFDAHDFVLHMLNRNVTSTNK
jgi:hypothetical protein